MNQSVVARLILDVIEPADVMLQIAVAHPTPDAESLRITTEYGDLKVAEVVIPGSGRVHRFQADKGQVQVRVQRHNLRQRTFRRRQYCR